MPQTPHAHVLLPLPFGNGFDYAIPTEMSLVPGSLVRVPFGRGTRIGVVHSLVQSSLANDKIKPIHETIDLPPFPPSFLAFLEWVASYTLSPLGNVVKMALPIIDAIDYEPIDHDPLLSLGTHKPERLTPERSKVIQLLEDGVVRTKQEILTLTGVNPSVLKGLMERQALIIVEKESASPSQPAMINLTNDQLLAVNHIIPHCNQSTYQCTLLDGVTGSGKTEVYMEVIAYLLEHSSKQSLVLLPEIALTNQFLSRFTRRFGFEPDIWHSNITPAKRKKTWLRIIKGEARVIIGARSALFLPYPQLGLIVVDEEHDSSYKQEEGVIYNARDMAVTRAFKEQFPIILASATPSLETYQHALSGKYHHVKLPSRFGIADMPDVHLIDLKASKLSPQRWIAPRLVDALRANLEQQQQSLLFLNRRGYAPLTVCNHCGHHVGCPDCATWLVEHKRSGYLMCHHCGYKAPKPASCPECHAADSLVSFGPGAERIVEEVHTYFPHARVELLSSDTMSSASKISELIDAILEKRVDILVGTQILAKGHHFPNLTLVGIIDAECGTGSGDYRSSERTYQLLHQVAGRAGREKAGDVYIQTFQPDNPLLKAIIDWNRDYFMEFETKSRQLTSMPPFSRLASLIISGANELDVQRFASLLVQAAPQQPNITLMGPTPAPIAHIRKQFRYRILVKSPKSVLLQPYLANWLQRAPIPSHIRLKVDVDPCQFY